MRTSFSSEGLVIKRKDVGEADKIVTIFSKNQGKISVIAKGVRKVTSRRAGNLELLSRKQVQLYLLFLEIVL